MKLSFAPPILKHGAPLPPPHPTPTLWSAVRDFFWVECLTLDIQQRAWALEVAKSYNPIGSNSAVLCLFFITFEKWRNDPPPVLWNGFYTRKRQFSSNY